jgi:DOPA 4,5-dioxygenase
MQEQDAPFHAHIYYKVESRTVAAALHSRLSIAVENGDLPGLTFVGQMRDHAVGPHPVPQFEIHFFRFTLPPLMPVLEASGLTVLVHPLTQDDVADHTSLGQWIGEPIPLDLTVLDPPGINQGIARFGKTDF